MLKNVRSLNWGTLAGAATGGTIGCGLAIPMAHAMASNLGYTLFVGTASASALSTGVLATIGLVGIGLILGGVALGMLAGSFIVKSVVSRSAARNIYLPETRSRSISLKAEATAPELGINSGLPRISKARSMTTPLER